MTHAFIRIMYVCEYVYYSRNAAKIAYLRPDTLSQLMHFGNIRAMDDSLTFVVLWMLKF